MRRIGIMGGTFDPVHNGHLLLGKQAYEEYALDEIWYMPSRQPPHKKDHLVTEAEDRLNMLYLALKDIPYCVVSEFEMKREGNTYTAQTMKLLKNKYPDTEFYFIIGADSLFQLESWYHPEEVMAMTTLLVSGRDCEGSIISMEEQIDHLRETFEASIEILHNSEVDISSEEIRRRVAEGKSIKKDVPELVAQYIESKGLYRQRDGEKPERLL